jgi:hypothetical protein
VNFFLFLARKTAAESLVRGGICQTPGTSGGASSTVPRQFGRRSQLHGKVRDSGAFRVCVTLASEKTRFWASPNRGRVEPIRRSGTQLPVNYLQVRLRKPCHVSFVKKLWEIPIDARGHFDTLKCANWNPKEGASAQRVT